MRDMTKILTIIGNFLLSITNNLKIGKKNCVII